MQIMILRFNGFKFSDGSTLSWNINALPAPIITKNNKLGPLEDKYIKAVFSQNPVTLYMDGDMEASVQFTGPVTCGDIVYAIMNYFDTVSNNKRLQPFPYYCGLRKVHRLFMQRVFQCQGSNEYVIMWNNLFGTP